MKKTLIALVLLMTMHSAFPAGPKYGPNAQPLSRMTNTDYFKTNPAPDYWTLAGFYLPQPNERTCSATNLTLVLNAARSSTDLKSDEKLLTVVDFIKNDTETAYAETMLGNKFDRSALTNKNLARILNLAIDKLKLRTPQTRVELVDIDLNDLKKSKTQFIAALKENEKSANDYIFFSFVQGTLTGDPEGGAHVATVGAYDEKKRLVLIMDPDREWYEPYWSPVDKVFESIADPKSDGLHPGYIHYYVR
jgi:hypothetical protein